MQFSELKSIIKSTYIPLTIIFPIPLVQFFIFSVAEIQNLWALFILIILSSLFSAGVNLWNHINDVIEDELAGKENPFRNAGLRKIGAILTILFYGTSLCGFYYLSVDKIAFLYISIVTLFTWFYSDRTFLGKLSIRLKEYYLTELVTYSVCWPLFVLSLWGLVAKINVTAYAVSILFLFFGLWNVFLKDLKDIEGDKLAGLRNLGVRFRPESLFGFSVLFICLYYFSIMFFSLSDIFPTAFVLTTFFWIFPVYTLRKLRQNNWQFRKVTKLLVAIPILNIFSLFIMGVLALLKL